MSKIPKDFDGMSKNVVMEDYATPEYVYVTSRIRANINKLVSN